MNRCRVQRCRFQLSPRASSDCVSELARLSVSGRRQPDGWSVATIGATPSLLSRINRRDWFQGEIRSFRESSCNWPLPAPRYSAATRSSSRSTRSSWSSKARSDRDASESRRLARVDAFNAGELRQRSPRECAGDRRNGATVRAAGPARYPRYRRAPNASARAGAVRDCT